MTNLIVTDAQDLEIDSPLVELFELIIGKVPEGQTANTNKLYFHAAKDLDGTDSNKDIIFDGNTYITLPIEMDDIEKKTSGAMNRPKLTVANVESLIKTGSSFKTQMEDGTWNSEIDGDTITSVNFKLDHLVGQRLIRRRTLEKYTGDTTAYEFDKEVFIIDRITSITPIFAEFELSSPADIGGIRVPNRQVIGKYCPWVYQGYSKGLTKSACRWTLKDQVSTKTDALKYSFYFTKDDEALVLSSHLPSNSTSGAWKGAWSSGSYSKGDYVSHSSKYTVTGGNGHVSSVNLTLVSGNDKIKAGFTATIDGNTRTISQIAGTRVVLDAAVEVDNGSSIEFVGPVLHYRSVGDSNNVEPAEGVLQWNIVRTYTSWSNSTTYTPNSYDPRQSPYVKHADTIWRALVTNLNVTPGTDETVWTRGDVCGKLLNSCKYRFQAKPIFAGSNYNADAVPHMDTDNNKALPFGGFPGSKKFR